MDSRAKAKIDARLPTRPIRTGQSEAWGDLALSVRRFYVAVGADGTSERPADQLDVSPENITQLVKKRNGVQHSKR